MTIEVSQKTSLEERGQEEGVVFYILLSSQLIY